MNKKISIILPVYNVEKYIKKCLDSIINQTYENIELIIVNDGSSDNSGNICEVYKEKDNRIKLIHIENAGVSNARNKALQEVTGEYIQFIDSDDFIEQNMIQEMLNHIETEKSDLVVAGFVNQEEKFSKLVLPEEEEKNYNIEEYAIKIINKPYSFIYGVLWNKLFKADIIKNNHIKFNLETNFGEDFIFVLEYLKYIKQVFVLKKGYYNYIRYNTNSLMYIQSKKIDYEEYCAIIEKRLIIYRFYKKFYEAIELYEKNKDKINEYMLGYWVGRYRVFFSKMTWKEKRACRKYILKNKELNQCIYDMETKYRVKKEILYWFQILKFNIKYMYIKFKK